MPAPATQLYVSGAAFEEGALGARKRVFIPGYGGYIHRGQETMAGTYAACSRDSHYLSFKGNHPTMVKPTLYNPNLYYARKPNPRFKTNCNNRSTFTLGDDREWNFDTIHQTHYRVPTKIPPRHESIMPGGVPANQLSKDELDRAYVHALNKTGVAGVRRLELAIRQKIDQRTSGGPMVLRKAFKYFDADASGDIDPDEFYAAMHAFGLEFTEDQVLALFGDYDVDRDGGLSYYEFIDKVLESDWADSGEREKVVLAVQLEDSDVEMKSVLRPEEINEMRCRKLFAHFDQNGSGEIDMRELGELVKSLGMRMEMEQINNAMVDLDKNNNGAISFEEFWEWFQVAAVTKNSGGAPSKLASRIQQQFENASNLEAQRPTAAKGSAQRPQTAVPSIKTPEAQESQADLEVQGIQATPVSRANENRASTRQGNWMTRELSRPKTAASWRRASNPDTKARPRTAFPPSRQPFGSDSWRSVSRSDFRPPSACSIPAPKLNISATRKRPTSAQPLLRLPGDCTAPYGSPSGFRL